MASEPVRVQVQDNKTESTVIVPGCMSTPRFGQSGERAPVPYMAEQWQAMASNGEQWQAVAVSLPTESS